MASILAALAYAEFGARYPRAGSAYSYVYFSMGEFLAFVVGWNVLLENILATSAVTQACGSYIDSLTGGAISNFIGEYIGFLTRPEALHVYNNVTSVADDVGQLGVDAPFLNNVPQLLVIPIMMAFVLVLLLGTTGSSTVGNILCGLNIAMLLVIIGIGLWKGRLNNWTDPQTGGFLPRGWHGVFSAASMCFFSYGGFDAISASAEEAKNPRRSLPIAIMSAMLTVTVLYVGVAASFTLLSNWSTLSSVDGFPETMRSNGIYWAQYLVTVGALCGMTTVGVVTLYTIARAAMSMAEDGLLCTVFANVWNRSQVRRPNLFRGTCVTFPLLLCLPWGRLRNCEYPANVSSLCYRLLFLLLPCCCFSFVSIITST